MKNAINWFEIPVSDFDRAKKFYEIILGKEVKEAPMPECRYGVLPYNHDDEGVGGGIVQMQNFKPSPEGVVIYLPGGEDLSVPLAKVEAAGGKIILPKTNIGENGFMAHFLDTEGNRLALHSAN